MAANGYTGNPPGSGGGGGGAVDSVNGRTGAVTLSKTDVGLSAVDNTADAAKPVSTAQQTALNLKAPLASPTFTGTVSGVTKAHVGLGSVDNTSDAGKPVSTAQQAALDLKANLASPTFTGTVAGITKAMVGLGNVDNTADTAKVVAQSQVTGLVSDLALKAPLASPTFTGTPAAPTATPGTNTTQLASTAFVTAAVAAGGGGGGTAPTFAGTYLTSGDIVPGVDAAWAVIPGLSFSIAAVAGDYVEFSAKALIDIGPGGPDNFFDPIIIVGGVPVRYASTGTSTSAAANEGDPALYPSSNVRFRGSVLAFDLEVQAGDLSGGTVTFGLAHKGLGNSKVFASTNYPFRWRVRNDH